jgi:hypothetical protein
MIRDVYSGSRIPRHGSFHPNPIPDPDPQHWTAKQNKQIQSKTSVQKERKTHFTLN